MYIYCFTICMYCCLNSCANLHIVHESQSKFSLKTAVPFTDKVLKHRFPNLANFDPLWRTVRHIQDLKNTLCCFLKKGYLPKKFTLAFTRKLKKHAYYCLVRIQIKLKLTLTCREKWEDKISTAVRHAVYI